MLCWFSLSKHFHSYLNARSQNVTAGMVVDPVSMSFNVSAADSVSGGGCGDAAADDDSPDSSFTQKSQQQRQAAAAQLSSVKTDLEASKKALKQQKEDYEAMKEENVKNRKYERG